MSFVDNLCLEIVFMFFHSVYVMILELSRYFIFGFMNNFLYVFVWIHIILYADYIDYVILINEVRFYVNTIIEYVSGKKNLM